VWSVMHPTRRAARVLLAACALCTVLVPVGLLALASPTFATTVGVQRSLDGSAAQSPHLSGSSSRSYSSQRLESLSTSRFILSPVCSLASDQAPDPSCQDALLLQATQDLHQLRVLFAVVSAILVALLGALTVLSIPGR
jgi:hypothetical protein